MYKSKQTTLIKWTKEKCTDIVNKYTNDKNNIETGLPNIKNAISSLEFIKTLSKAKGGWVNNNKLIYKKGKGITEIPTSIKKIDLINYAKKVQTAFELKDKQVDGKIGKNTISAMEKSRSKRSNN